MKPRQSRLIVCALLQFTLLNSSTHAERPNIIFILANDLGYGDLGCYGQELIRTPNIDKLANEGIRLTQAYAGAPWVESVRIQTSHDRE